MGDSRLTPGLRRVYLDRIDMDLQTAAAVFSDSDSGMLDDDELEVVNEHLGRAFETADKLSAGGDEHPLTAEIEDSIGAALHAESADEIQQTITQARNCVTQRQDEPDVGKRLGLQPGPQAARVRKLKALRAMQVGKRGGRYYEAEGGKKVYVKE